MREGMLVQHYAVSFKAISDEIRNVSKFIIMLFQLRQ